jgi:hypothetical protein
MIDTDRKFDSMKSFYLIPALLLMGVPARSALAEGFPAPEVQSVRKSAGDSKLAWAFKSQISEIRVQCKGTVTLKLDDDSSGSRHQRFIITLDSGQTLLIIHNIDLAPRVRNLKLNDRVRISGEYIWNSQGGLIHETHRDPQGIEVSGWIKHRGKTYR